MSDIDFEHTRWQAQESARLGLGGDAAERAVALALAASMPIDLPANFATQVAARALAEAAPPSAAIEQGLWAVGLGLLALTLGFLGWWTPELGQTVWRDLQQSAGSGWLLWLGLALLLAALQPLLIPRGKTA